MVRTKSLTLKAEKRDNCQPVWKNVSSITAIMTVQPHFISKPINTVRSPLRVCVCKKISLTCKCMHNVEVNRLEEELIKDSTFKKPLVVRHRSVNP